MEDNIREESDLESEISEVESEFEEWKKMKSKFFIRKVVSNDDTNLDLDLDMKEKEEEYVKNEYSYHRNSKENWYKIPMENVMKRYKDKLSDYDIFEWNDENMEILTNEHYFCCVDKYWGKVKNGYYFMKYKNENSIWRLEIENNNKNIHVIVEEDYYVFYRMGKITPKSKLRKQLEGLCEMKTLKVKKKRNDMKMNNKKKEMNKYMEKLEKEDDQDLIEKILESDDE